MTAPLLETNGELSTAAMAADTQTSTAPSSVSALCLVFPCHVSCLPLHATAFWYPPCWCGKISVCGSRCLLSCVCWARSLLMVTLRVLVHWQFGSTTKFSTLRLDASRDKCRLLLETRKRLERTVKGHVSRLAASAGRLALLRLEVVKL